jgi:hypothetical protein
VDPARRDQLVELVHGHPLGLSLLADVVVRGGEAATDPLTPDLVGTLLRRFVEIVPSGLHRHALEVCALRHGGQRLRATQGLGGSKFEPEAVVGRGTQFSEGAAGGPPPTGGDRNHQQHDALAAEGIGLISSASRSGLATALRPQAAAPRQCGLALLW